MRPIMSIHALERCKEMDIDVDRVRRVLSNPHLRYDSSNGYTVFSRADEPTFRVVFNSRTNTVVTVIWWTDDDYERGAGAYTHPQQAAVDRDAERRWGR